MRLKDVLSYNESDKSLSFSLQNLCKMRDITTGDVTHVGNTVKRYGFGKSGMSCYKLFGNYNIVYDKSTGNLGIGKMDVSDFTLGLFVVVPIMSILLCILYQIPLKVYFVLSVIAWLAMKK